MNQERVVKAGLLGLGTVGSGVYKLVECQKDEMAMKAGAGLKIQKILVHNMNKKRDGVDQSLLTDKWEDIMKDDEIEIGYVVHPRYQGCGYATEAVHAVITELREMGFRKITAGYFAENTASLRVMEKYGMRQTDETEEEEYHGRKHICKYCELCF